MWARLGMTMSDLSWTDIECSSFKPPHYLQACTKNLPLWKACIQNNQLPIKSQVYLEDNSIVSVVCDSYQAEVLFQTDSGRKFFWISVERI